MKETRAESPVMGWCRTNGSIGSLTSGHGWGDRYLTSNFISLTRCFRMYEWHSTQRTVRAT